MIGCRKRPTYRTAHVCASKYFVLFTLVRRCPSHRLQKKRSSSTQISPLTSRVTHIMISSMTTLTCKTLSKKARSRYAGSWYSFDLLLLLTSIQEPLSVDDIIARRKLRVTPGKRKRPVEDEGDEEDSDSEEEVEEESEEDDDESGASEDDFQELEEAEEEEDPLATSGEESGEEGSEDGDMSQDDASDADAASSSEDESEEETQAEKERKAAFFEAESGPSEAHTSFLSMNLSRPIIKSLTSLGFTTPTPIQAATIPVALLGKDIVGNAVTGSGKTAAFIIPMLERLMYRDRGKKAAATRCLVLVPTRELGVQCFEVGAKLAAHTDIRFALVVGSSNRCRPSIRPFAHMQCYF